MNKKHKFVIMFLCCLFVVLLQTVVFCAISSTMNISGIAKARIATDVRITDLSIYEVGSGVNASYEEFSKDVITSGVTFSSASSFIIYRVTVKNYSNSSVAISNITGLNNNLNYELIDYNLGDILCDINGNCGAMATKEFFIKIYGNLGDYSISLHFEFKLAHNVTYNNIDGSEYPNSVMDGDTLTVNFLETPVGKVAGYIDGKYVDSATYLNNVYTVSNVTGDIEIKAENNLYNISSIGAKNDNGIKYYSSYNNDGLNYIDGTKNDRFPIYYYRGNVSDNNVVFANKCWKIVRTTELGGSKIVYNGTVNSDGGCNNTGDSTTIGKSPFNSQRSLTGAGYMYGSGPSYSSNSMGSQIGVYQSISFYNTNYYFGTSVSYNNGVYTLDNSKLIEWSYSNDLTGYYTCKQSSDTSCSTVYYVAYYSSSTGYVVQLSNGQLLESQNLTFGKEVVDNGNNTYSLKNVTTISITEWADRFSEFENYYVCSDLTSTTCNKKYKIGLNSTYGFYTIEQINYIFGNNVSYNNGKYTLVDTFTATEWVTDLTTLGNKYHYTCLSSSNSCETVYYIFQFENTSATYFSLNGGKKISDLIDDAFVDVNDSDVKTLLDTWYLENLIGYGNMIEDTIWNNEKTFVTGPLSNLDISSSSKISYTSSEFPATFKYQDSVVLDFKSNNKDFNYTVNDVNNGNGKLKYSIGLLTLDELLLIKISNRSYLYNGLNWLSMTPLRYYTSMNGLSMVYVCSYNLCNGSSVSSHYVRPSIVLKNDVIINKGDGSVSNPYVVDTSGN